MSKKMIVIIVGNNTVTSLMRNKMNEYLRELKNQDQAAKSGGTIDCDWAIVYNEETERRMKEAEILKIGEVGTAENFYNAALTFQHGISVDNIQLACSHAQVLFVKKCEKPEIVKLRGGDHHFHKKDITRNITLIIGGLQ